MAQPNLAGLLAPGARARNLDLNALLAIASHEGAGGGIGDNGHAFGPFQENNAGGVLTGRFKGQSPQQINQWAWSPAGINDALTRISGVASGLRGPAAVKAIASRFERPANIQAEISDALAHYGKGGGSGPAPVPVSGGTTAAQPLQSPGVLGGLLASTNQMLGLGSSPALANLLNAAWGGHEGSGATVGGKAGEGQKGLPPANGPSKLANIDGIQVDSRVAPEVQSVLQQFHVTPTSGYRSPGHNAQIGGAENSDHLRGDAVDFGGNPQQLAALYRWARRQNFPYVEPMAQAKNHVHISFSRASA